MDCRGGAPVSAVTRLWVVGVLLLTAAACGGDDDPPRQLTREQLLDPENCKDCHPKHYDEWSASMHAYAARDPVFIAMNKRMQEEAPQNKEFCVQCHAPMALRENKITNFADLSDVPKQYQGVTCYFCHNAVNVKNDHFNANIDLANDTIMRGALDKPVQSAAAHGVSPTKSIWHDPGGIESSTLCGTCHDIKAPSGDSIERTFQEYMSSISSKPGAGRFNSCQDCHMKKKPLEETAAMVEGVGKRKVHSHLFPAVDIALTPDMPNQDALRAAIEKSELQACTLSQFDVEIGNSLPKEPFDFTVTIEQLSGHNFPSGASADRRLWIEIVATDETGQVVFETGRIADGELEEKPEGDPKFDPQFKPFRDRLIDAEGNETHMFWEAVKHTSDLLPFATNPDPAVTHSARRTFTTKGGLDRPPARIEMWLRLRPMGVDVLQDLVKSGHLDPAVIQAMPTLTVGHVEAIYIPEKHAYETSELISDAQCKVFQTLSDLKAPAP
jgi:nitrate/TMAO reductase-like tetraheme cytochrome c subunit